MHAFNRFFVILTCVAGVIFWCLLILLVWALPRELAVALSQTGSVLRNNPLVLQSVLGAFGASSILLALLVLAGEFSGERQGTVRIPHAGTGQAEIDSDSIATRLRERLSTVDGLVTARPRVQAPTNGVLDVQVEAQARPGMPLPPLAEAISTAVQDVVEAELGVQLRAVKVSFFEHSQERHEELRASATTARPPAEITVPGMPPGDPPAPA